MFEVFDRARVFGEILKKLTSLETTVKDIKSIHLGQDWIDKVEHDAEAEAATESPSGGVLNHTNGLVEGYDRAIQVVEQAKQHWLLAVPSNTCSRTEINAKVHVLNEVLAQLSAARNNYAKPELTTMIPLKQSHLWTIWRALDLNVHGTISAGNTARALDISEDAMDGYLKSGLVPVTVDDAADLYIQDMNNV